MHHWVRWIEDGHRCEVVFLDIHKAAAFATLVRGDVSSVSWFTKSE
jgi:hypothetical protein